MILTHSLTHYCSSKLLLTPPKSRGNLDVPSYMDNKPFLIAEKLFVSVNFGEIKPKNATDKYLHVTYKTEFFVKDSVLALTPYPPTLSTYLLTIIGSIW